MQVPTDQELASALEHADAKMIERSVPIPFRPTEALALLWPDVQFPIVAREAAERMGGAALLATRVSEWFETRYGTKVALAADLARLPVLIRNEVYLARVPLAYGAPTLQPLDLIEGLTEDLRRSLRPHEAKSIQAAYAEGLALVYELDDARAGRGGATIEPRAEVLLEKALNDRTAAARCFEARPDTNGACFRAQQHAEKLGKALLVQLAGYTEKQLKKGLSHNLQRLLDECRSIRPAVVPAPADVATLARVTMDYRYTTPAVTIRDAHDVFWAALRIGALCACETFDIDRRGGDVRLVPPEGYEDRLAKTRRQLVRDQWPNIVENHRVAIEAWGSDVAVVVLDLRDEWARGIAETLRQPIESTLAELDAPGGHLKSGHLMFGLPRRDAMRHVAYNRSTPIQGFDRPPAGDMIMVAVVSGDGYEAFCVERDGPGAESER